MRFSFQNYKDQKLLGNANKNHKIFSQKNG